MTSTVTTPVHPDVRDFVSFKIAPALAAGNTVVLKPAEQTPLTPLPPGELFEVAGTRLYVEDSVFDEFTPAVAEVAAQVKIGPGMDPATQLGPLVFQERFDRVSRYLAEGLADGARALTGGKRWAARAISSSPPC